MDAEDSGMEIETPDVAEDGEMDCLEGEVECLLDDKPQRVIEGLFIGSAWAEMNKPALQKAGITDILQVAQGLFPRHPLCYKYMVLQVEDSPTTDLVRYFPKCFEFIDAARNQGGSVLVHCAAGVSRSATVVLGYLMAREGLSLTAALEHLKAVRPWVAPNTGFMQQLTAYESAGCDLSDWTPWHLVWYQQQQHWDDPVSMQQQQQQQHQQPSQQQQQQQDQQRWLKLPQPCDKITSIQQRQQRQEELPLQQLHHRQRLKLEDA